MFKNPIKGYVNDQYKHRLEIQDVDMDMIEGAELQDYNEKYAMFKGGKYDSIIVINKEGWKDKKQIIEWLNS